MTSTPTLVARMRANPRNVRYADLMKVCQDYKGKAKAYQVRQTLAAIDRLEAEVASEMVSAGEKVPIPLSHRSFSGTFLVRVSPDLLDS